MEREHKIKIFSLAIYFAAAGLIAVLLYFYVSRSHADYSPVHAWCDAAFVTGIIFASISFLSLISKRGGFDMLSFAFKKIKSHFFRKENSFAHETYFDYTEKKSSARKPFNWQALVTGLLLLGLSLALLALC